MGGHNLISMTALRELLTELGFERVHTVLQSGSVVLDGTLTNSATLEREIERHFGRHIDVLLRSRVEIDSVVASNPFTEEARSDPGRLLAMFTADEPVDVEALARYCTADERIERGARHLYLYYPKGAGRSKLTGAVIERHLRTRGTARNWNTVLRIRDLLSANGA